VTPDPDEPGSGSADEAELGEPIGELQDVSWPVSERFDAKLRGRIERRLLGGSLLELAWTAPRTLVLEFIGWLFEGHTDRRSR
jgi:hypothetical protein